MMSTCEAPEAQGFDQVLDTLEQGVLWLGPDLRVIGHNASYRRLLEIDEPDFFLGQPYQALLEFLVQRGEFPEISSPQAFVQRRLADMQQGQSRRFERVRPNGCVLEIFAQALPAGGFVYTYCDRTALVAERELVRRNAKAMVVALANFAEHRDSDTGVHVLRVARMVGQIGFCLLQRGCFQPELDNHYVQLAMTASILHDVGKIATPDSILLKVASLTDAEHRVIQKHTVSGASMLLQAQRLMANSSSYLNMGATIALSHHEWYDGSGYPHGLAGNDIPLAARICAVADVYDALITQRPYKPAWACEMALHYIRRQRGTQFDPLVVDALAEVVRQRLGHELVSWDESLSVGHRQIDEQHLFLIDTINLLASLDGRSEAAIVAMVIDELIGYASFHFHFEEGLMAASAYPDLEQHKLKHQAFFDTIAAMRDSLVQTRRNTLGASLMVFLRDWLKEHIMGEDQKYRAALNRCELP